MEVSVEMLQRLLNGVLMIVREKKGGTRDRSDEEEQVRVDVSKWIF